MTTRAKFKVQSVTLSQHWVKGKGLLATVDLSPVTSGSEENESFFEATPGGQIKLSVLNQAAAQMFEPGAEIYVDFTRAPSKPVDPPISI